MTSHNDLVTAFENGTLSPGAFPHREHVRLAWCYLRRYPLAEAAARFTAGIRALSAAAGKPEKYHETVTWAYLLLINDRLAHANTGSVPGQAEADAWEAFAASNADLIADGRSVLECWYRRDTLESALARETFLWPDRSPTPPSRRAP